MLFLRSISLLFQLTTSWWIFRSLNCSSFSNNTFSNKTFSTVKNTYLKTFSVVEAETLAVCLSELYRALFFYSSVLLLFVLIFSPTVIHNRFFLNPKTQFQTNDSILWNKIVIQKQVKCSFFSISWAI